MTTLRLLLQIQSVAIIRTNCVDKEKPSESSMCGSFDHGHENKEHNQHYFLGDIGSFCRRNLFYTGCLVIYNALEKQGQCVTLNKS